MGTKTETLHTPAAANETAVRPRQSFYRRYEPLILGGGAVLLVLAVWQACWSAGWISPLFLSGPSAIAKQFWETLRHGTLLADMAYSGRNFLVGFVLALVSVGFGIAGPKLLGNATNVLFEGVVGTRLGTMDGPRPVAGEGAFCTPVLV